MTPADIARVQQYAVRDAALQAGWTGALGVPVPPKLSPKVEIPLTPTKRKGPPMKIEGLAKQAKVEFNVLEQGDTFTRNGRLYMKLSDAATGNNAVNLADGKIGTVSGNTEVTQVIVTVTVTEIKE